MPKYYKSFLRGVQTQPKGLKYKPRYYDPEKEAFDARIKEIEMKYSKEDQGSAITRAKVQRNIDSNRFRQKARKDNKAQMIKVMALIVLLFSVAYKMFTYINNLPQ